MKDDINVTIRIEREAKRQADQLFEELGLNFSAAVKIYIYKCIRERRIPFKISLSDTQSQQLVAIFAKDLDVNDIEKIVKHNTL